MANPSAGRTIVVAVDFGTTFSGVAWAQTGNADTHYIINEWPQRDGTFGGITSEKVPTEIAFEYPSSGVQRLWGFQIPDNMPRHQWIKLGLVPDPKSGIGSRLSSTYTDCRRVPPPYHSSPEGLVTEYLECLHEHTLRVLKAKIGQSFDSMGIKFVITVPAMWPEKAKVQTLRSAEKAGFGQQGEIQIISEPEAAAMHALQASNPHGLNVGDTIVLCDAGGGTVDLITFSVLQLRPSLQLKEEAPGNGSLCGSTFLNLRFEEFIQRRLSSCPGWGRDTLDDALNRFEIVKRTFAGNPNDDFLFPVPGIADDERKGVTRGRLCVSGHEMAELFHPVLCDVLNLVNEQIDTSTKKVKSVFLVGGFGQSPYLRKYLREKVPAGVDVIPVVNGWTAVVRGALAKVLAETTPLVPQLSVKSRVARKNYGLTKSTKFKPRKHDITKRYWDDFDGKYRIQVMSWFIRKGDEIQEAKPIQTEWRRKHRVAEGQCDSIRVQLYELDTPKGTEAPLYFNRHMKTHAVLNPDLDTIEKSRIPVVRGKDGEDYYQVDYEIHATYFSAHCQYALWYEGKDHGSVKVEYA